LRGLALAALLLLIAAAGGCTFSLHDSLFAAPGKFDDMDCARIAGTIREAIAREDRLNELIRRDTGGVNAITYQNDLNIAREDVWGLRQASDAKQCPALNR
jgi:hypothetical protein